MLLERYYTFNQQSGVTVHTTDEQHRFACTILADLLTYAMFNFSCQEPLIYWPVVLEHV